MWTFFRIPFDLPIMFLSISLCIAFLVVALGITLFIHITVYWCHHFTFEWKNLAFSYRHTLFYCASSETAFFTNWSLWQLYIEQVCWHRFSNNICSLCVSGSRFGNNQNIIDFFTIIIFVMVISDLWCSCGKKIMTCWRFRWWSAFFTNKVFF